MQTLEVLYKAFKGDENDIVEVQIEAAMAGPTVTRTVRLYRCGREIVSSDPTPILRASR